MYDFPPDRVTRLLLLLGGQCLVLVVGITRRVNAFNIIRMDKRSNGVGPDKWITTKGGMLSCWLVVCPVTGDGGLRLG